MARSKKTKFKQNDNNFAIAYYRYSSRAQNEESIDQQREMALKYAQEHGLEIIKEYSDEAESGWLNENRPGFNLMLKEIPHIKPSTLIIWKTDRMARDRLAAMKARSLIRNSGCAIRCVAENIPDDGNVAVIMESIFDALAEQYSLNLSENVTRGLYYNAERGLYNGVPMLGYKKGKDKHYEIDGNTASLVIQCFNDYAAGKSMALIADEFNKKGFKTIRKKPFKVNSIRSILKNRSYLGEYRFGDVFIPDAIPQLINPELFERVQKSFNQHKRKHLARNDKGEPETPRFWLTGKLFCGKCGEPLLGISGTSKNTKIHYYYICRNKRRHCCTLKAIRKEVIELAVIKIMDDILLDTAKLTSLAVDVNAYYQEHQLDDTMLKALEKSKSEVEKSLNNVLKAIEQGIITETTRSRLLELELQKKELDESISKEKEKLSRAKEAFNIQHFYDYFGNSDYSDDSKRDIIMDYFFKKIYVFEDKVIVTCAFSDESFETDLDDIIECLERESVYQCSSSSHSRPPIIKPSATYEQSADAKLIAEGFFIHRLNDPMKIQYLNHTVNHHVYCTEYVFSRENT